MFQYLYGNAVGVPETGAVTFGKDCVGNLHFAFDHEQVNAVLLAMQFVFLHQSRIQRTHREPGILVDGSRGRSRPAQSSLPTHSSSERGGYHSSYNEVLYSPHAGTPRSGGNPAALHRYH